MPRSSDDALKADGVLVFVTVLAAAGWFFSLYALRGLPTLYFIGIRFAMAGLLLVGCCLRPLARMGARDLKRAAKTGVVMCLVITLWTKGVLASDNLGVGAFICSLGNVVAPVVGRVFFKLRMSRVTWVAVATATLGLAFLSLRDGMALSAADLYFLGSAASNALYLNLNGRYAARLSPLPLAAIQLTVVGVLALALAPFEQTWPDSVDGVTVAWLLASVLIATSLRFFLLVWGQRTAPISHAALILNLEPVWTALAAAVLLGTTIGGLQLAGCGLIFLGLVLPRLPRPAVGSGTGPARP